MCTRPEPYDKAVAYAIQGHAALWCSGIEGCYYNIMGLPVRRTAQLLKEISAAVTLCAGHGAKETKMANFLTRLFHRISEGLHNMFSKDIGIDLGTANTLVYMKGRGIIMREPSVVAVDTRTEELRVRCVGHEAKAVIGRAPGVHCGGAAAERRRHCDFDITAAMLQSFIRQACGRRWFARPRVVICVPSGVTEVERRAVRQAAAPRGRAAGDGH